MASYKHLWASEVSKYIFTSCSYVIDSWNHLGYKRSLRSLSPTVNPTVPSPPKSQYLSIDQDTLEAKQSTSRVKWVSLIQLSPRSQPLPCNPFSSMALRSLLLLLRLCSNHLATLLAQVPLPMSKASGWWGWLVAFQMATRREFFLLLKTIFHFLGKY